jgi:TetR/AcrR family transcriptional repressor of nem operon
VLNDVARGSETLRTIYTSQIQKKLAAITTLMKADDASQNRSDALLTLCTLMGAIGLARAVNDHNLANEILDTKHTLLKALEK